MAAGKDPPSGLRGRAAFLAVAAAAWLPVVSGVVDCSLSPNCTELRRQLCDPYGTQANACGDCLVGTHGANGPINNLCLSSKSCAALYPGFFECPVPVGTVTLPLLVPFGTCVCDEGQGYTWPTAPGKCAKVEVAVNGLFSLKRCSTRTCDPASCDEVTSWSPLTAGGARFPCNGKGADSALLSDSCEEVLGDLPDRALCGHPGLVNAALDGSRFVVSCAVAPECPYSVEKEASLEDSCCNGHPYSFLMEGGVSTGVRAPGFCEPTYVPPATSLIGIPIEVTIVGGRGFKDLDSAPGTGTSDVYCTGEIPGKPTTWFRTSALDNQLDPAFNREQVIKDNDVGDALLFRCYDQDFGTSDGDLGSAIVTSTQLNQTVFKAELQMLSGSETVGYLTVEIKSYIIEQGFGCAVQTSGPGWKGCSCRDGQGKPWADRVCTVECKPPACPLPSDGVPPTPSRWATTQLPLALRPPDRSARITSTAAAASPPAWLLLLAAWLAAGAGAFGAPGRRASA